MRALLMLSLLLPALVASCAHQQARVVVVPPIFVPQPPPEPPHACFNCFDRSPFTDPDLKDI